MELQRIYFFALPGRMMPSYCKENIIFRSSLHNTATKTHFLLEPLHGVLLSQSMLEANLSLLAAAVGNIESWPAEDDVEVQTIDTNARVVLDSQVNVFLNTETKVAGGWEVVSSQFIFPHLLKKENSISFNFYFINSQF